MSAALPAAPLAAEDRARVAVRCGELALEYGELADRVEALRERLSATPHGIAVGLRIGNEPAFVVAFLACLAARRRVVLLDTLWTPAELRHAASKLRVSCLLETASTPGAGASAELFGVASLRIESSGELAGELDLIAPATGSGLEAAAVVYWSSGSTGQPKPIGVSAAALAHRLATYAAVSRLDATDRMLCVLPLSHCHGIECVALPILAARGELVLLDPLAAEPGRVVRTIQERGITAFSALPRFFEFLVGADVPPAALSTLRHVMSGSAAIDPEVAARFEQRFGPRIGLGYGLTEIGVVCLNQHEHGPVRYDSVGPVIGGIEWRIAANDAAPADGVGELQVRSAGCALGVAAGDGWLATRDLVRTDEDGYLHVVGRLSTFINVGGAKADPREIEGVIAELSWVEECAVMGVPLSEGSAPGGSERIVAYVAPRPPEDVPYPEEAVQQRVAESLSIFKVPSQVIVLDALPRTTIGKLAYGELPDPASSRSLAPAGAEAPRDEAERAVAGIWCALLGLGSVGVRDGFTRLGGSSVHLAELAVRLEQRFGRAVTVVDLFRHPSVEAQARFLSGAVGDSGADLRAAARDRAARQRAALRAVSGREGAP